jgi:hypothetical protein
LHHISSSSEFALRSELLPARAENVPTPMRLKASVFPVILAVALLCLLAICTVAVPLYSESPFIVDGPYRSAAAVKEERPDT